MKKLYLQGQEIPAGRAIKACRACGRQFTLPKCWEHRHHSCSDECKKSNNLVSSAELIVRRTRSCGQCGKLFVAKKSQIDAGQGNHCSVACAWKGGRFSGVHPEENCRKRGIIYKKLISDGSIIRDRGENHPLWKGGGKASRERNKQKIIAYTREYRKNNPHKTREWAQRRKKRKLGRLPKGTIHKIFQLQKGRCAACGSALREKFHVDHIMPLMLGGEHEPLNLQILCATCNVRKWAKDPIDFMQEMGFLI